MWNRYKTEMITLNSKSLQKGSFIYQSNSVTNASFIFYSMIIHSEHISNLKSPIWFISDENFDFIATLQEQEPSK